MLLPSNLQHMNTKLKIIGQSAVKYTLINFKLKLSEQLNKVYLKGLV